VLGHVNYETVKNVEEKAERAKREEMDKEGGQKAELGVRVLWKPYLESMYLFESIGGE
jgi:translation initiation factor 2D